MLGTDHLNSAFVISKNQFKSLGNTSIFYYDAQLGVNIISWNLYLLVVNHFAFILKYLYIYIYVCIYIQLIGFFMSVLPSFEYHFNSILLTFITGVCSEIPCSIVLRFAETSYLNFIEIQLTGCHIMRDLGVGISQQITNSFIFFIFLFTCSLLLYSSFEGIF